MGTPLHGTVQTPPPPLPGATMLYRLILLFAFLFALPLLFQDPTKSTAAQFPPQNISSAARIQEQTVWIGPTKREIHLHSVRARTSNILDAEQAELIILAFYWVIFVVLFCLFLLFIFH